MQIAIGKQISLHHNVKKVRTDSFRLEKSICFAF